MLDTGDGSKSERVVEIVDVIADPPGADKGKEKIFIRILDAQGTDDLRRSIADKKYSLNIQAVNGEVITILPQRSLPNRTGCITIRNGEDVVTQFCYLNNDDGAAR